MPNLPEEFQDKGTEFDRVKAMSDGVFAIVLTLLVLELKVPEVVDKLSDQELWESLVALWPKIIAYVLSYLVIGLYWVVHNRLFRHIVRYDRKLLWQNLFFLLTLSFLPFTTALSGSYHDSPLAWALYTLNISATGLASNAIWWRAVKDDLVEPGMSDLMKKYLGMRGLPLPIVFIVSVPVAYYDVDAARGVILLIPPAMYLVQRSFARQVGEL